MPKTVKEVAKIKVCSCTGVKKVKPVEDKAEWGNQ